MVGTRPEAIKLAPVAAALAALELPLRLVLTGQHPLDPAEFGLGNLPRLALGIPGARDPRRHAQRVAEAMAAAIVDPPSLLLVQGDTSSALGGALAAERRGWPLAHVEAGLRSFDLASPWPEEGNRVAIDRLSDLLFAPTVANAANLRAEAVAGAVHVTGNSGIDALLGILPGLPPPPSPHPDGRLRLLVTCHRRESWGAGLTHIAQALRELDRLGGFAVRLILHPNPAVARAMRTAVGSGGVEFAAPLDHRAMIAAMRASDLILSDSGGIQEEAPALGIPLLVLRRTTERPEGIASGNTRLVGTERDPIVAAVLDLTDPAARAAMAVPSLPFGDGRAGSRIAEVVADFVAAAGRPRRRA